MRKQQRRPSADVVPAPDKAAESGGPGNAFALGALGLEHSTEDVPGTGPGGMDLQAWLGDGGQGASAAAAGDGGDGLASTKGGTTRLSSDVRNHPARQQVEAHERAHREQALRFAEGAPAASESALEAEAQRAAEAGPGYPIRLGAPPDMALGFSVDPGTAAALVANKDAPGIVAFVGDDAALASADAAVRAGMIGVLADRWSMSASYQEAAWTLLQARGEHARVLELLDMAGTLHTLVRKLTDDALAKQLADMLRHHRPPYHDPDADAAITTKSKDAIHELTNLADLTDDERLGLLRVLFTEGWVVGLDDEWLVLDLLRTAGDLRGLMTRMRGLGLTELMFDVIDNEGPCQELISLLSELGDPQIDADLEVFASSWLTNLVHTVLGGLGMAVDQLTGGGLLNGIWHLLSGLFQPILDPLGSLAHLWTQLDEMVQTADPSSLEWWDQLVTLLRDVAGFVAIWSLAIAGALFAGGLVAAAGALALSPTGAGGAAFAAVAVALESGSAFFGTVAAWAGGAFIGLALARTALDLIQGASSSTDADLQREQSDIAEDATIGAVILLLQPVGRWVKQRVDPLRGWIRGVAERQPPANPKPPPFEGASEEAVRARDALAEREGVSKKRAGKLEAKQVDARLVQKLIERGADSNAVTQLAADFGNAALRAATHLMNRGYTAEQALRTAREAGRADLLAEVELMAADQTFSSNLNEMIQLVHEAAKGKTGYSQAIRDAASALARGHRVELEKGADVVDHTGRRATQHKELTSKRSDEVVKKTKDAAEQLRGTKGEQPPAGYERVIDIRVVNEANPLYEAGAGRWLHELNRASSMEGVDAVKVTNNKGTFFFTSQRANGLFEQVPMLPITTAPDQERK